MTEKRFKITQNGDLFTVRDTIKNKPMGVFEFKEDEFPVYFCFHKIIDLMNDLSDENEQLKLICKDHRDHANDFKADCVRLEKENEQLKSENNMLKVTIGRNEAYIKRLTETSEWHC